MKEDQKSGLRYDFKKLDTGRFEVSLCGFFVCYRYDTSESAVDNYLKTRGFKSRLHYVDDCILKRKSDSNWLSG